MVTAQDIMSEEVVVIYDDMMIRQVAHLMLRDRVSVFPVVSKDIGMVGIITMTDLFTIINNASHTGKGFHDRIDHEKEMKVSDVMSKEVVTIDPETTIDEIINLVVEQGIHAFPVLEKGKLTGIVSRHDILNAIFTYD